MPHPVHEVTAGGRTMRWRGSDPRSAPETPLRVFVLLHAFPLSAAMWEEQLDAFSGWQVIAPETRGFRGPDVPAVEPPGEPTMDDLACDIEQLLGAIGVTEGVIGGLSMGGYLAFALFRRAPARFRGLVLASTTASADSEQARDARRKMRALVERGGPGAVADDILPKLLAATTHRDHPDLARGVRTLIEANSTDAIKGAIAAMLTRPDSRALLAEIACPTLILSGDEDVLIPPSASEEMHQAIRRSERVRLPRCGHLANLEQPREFNRAVDHFLQNLA